MERLPDVAILAWKLDLPHCAACRVVLQPQARNGMERRWCSEACRSWRRRHPDRWAYRKRRPRDLERETIDVLAAWADDSWISGRHAEAAALLRVVRAGS